jgi:hypothetical protein
MVCGDDWGKKEFQRVPEVQQHEEKLSSGLKGPSALEQATRGLKSRPPREKTFSNLSFFAMPGIVDAVPLRGGGRAKPVAYILMRLRLQYKYTGIPASRITKPKALFAG